MSRQRQKGTSWESAIVKYLTDHGYEVMRMPLHGAADKGDIYGLPVTIEAKNVRVMNLAQWVKEATLESLNAGTLAGVVWHKKKGSTDPGEAYVTMTGSEFLKILGILS